MTRVITSYSIHYTKLYDIAIITKYAMTFPKFMEIACSPKYKLEATDVHPEPRIVTHTNYMMSPLDGGPEYYYPYVKGIKTGTLDEAGRCLVTTAVKDGYNYLLVTRITSYNVCYTKLLREEIGTTRMRVGGRACR